MAWRKINIRRCLPFIGLSIALVSIGAYIYMNDDNVEEAEVMTSEISAYEPLSGGVHKGKRTKVNLDRPTNLSVKNTEEGIYLSWEEVADAIGYEVEVNGQIVAEVFESTYLQEESIENMSYTYRVRPKRFKMVGEWSQPLQVLMDENKEIASQQIALIYNYALTYGNQVVLHWEDEKTDYILEVDGKKVNDFTFKEGVYTYIHQNVIPGNTHTYVIQKTDEIKETVKVTTKPITMQTESRKLVLDGKISDWSNASLVYQKGEKRLYSAQSDTQIALAASGVNGEGACFFLDTDLDGTTGYQVAGFAYGGADVLVDGESVYKYIGDGSNWKWQEVGNARYRKTQEGVEVIIDKADIGISGVKPYGLGYNDAQETLMPATSETMQISWTKFVPNTSWMNTEVSSKTGITNVLINFEEVMFATAYEVRLNDIILGTTKENSYRIKHLQLGRTYEISVRPIMGEIKGSFSKPCTISLQPMQHISGYIEIDGNLEDWEVVPTYTKADEIELKVAQDKENLYVCIKGEGKETQIFIDSDMEETTGYKLEAFMDNGADYIIDGTSVYGYSGSGEDWSWLYLGEAESSIALLEETAPLPDFVEMIIPKAMLSIEDDFELGVGIREEIYLSQEEGMMTAPTVNLTFDSSLLKPPTVQSSLATLQTVTLSLQGNADYYMVEFNDTTYKVMPDEEENIRLSVRNLNPNITYSYRLCSVKGSNQGAWSEWKMIHTRNYNFIPKCPIVIDTNKSDWLSVTPLMKNKTNDGILYFALDETDLYFFIQSQIGFKADMIYIDVDPLAGTGYKGSEWLAAGIDYMIEQGNLYHYAGDGQSWEWNKLQRVSDFFDVGDTIEGKLPLNQIGLKGIHEIWIGLEGSNQELQPKAGESLFVVTEVFKNE